MAYAGKPQVLRWYNSGLVEELILNQGPITKPEIAQITQLSLPTVNKIVEELVGNGVVIENGMQNSNSVGRRAKTYIINGNVGSLLSVYFIDNKWIGNAYNMLGYEIAKAEYPCHSQSKLTDLYTVIDELKSSAPKAKAIGVGIPGGVLKNGRVESIPAIPELKGVFLADLLEEKYSVPVVVENDVKLMTVGYYSKKTQNVDNILFIYIGSRIGAGLIINGQLYKGNNSFAGELGYMPLFKKNEEKAQAEYGGNLEGRLTELKKKNDMESFYKLLGVTLSDCTTVINPEVIVLYSTEYEDIDTNIVEAEMLKYLPSYCIPQICFTTDYNYGFDGLLQMCREISQNECWLQDIVEEKG